MWPYVDWGKGGGGFIALSMYVAGKGCSCMDLKHAWACTVAGHTGCWSSCNSCVLL